MLTVASKGPKKTSSSTSSVVRSYGWVPDLPDHRDYMFAAPMMALAALPPKVDLRSQCPKTVYDQGQLGSCTANAIAGAIEFDEIKQKAPHRFTPSRLFVYYNERDAEGTVNSDSGAMIRDGVKSVANLGYPPETEWPYSDDSSSTGKFLVKPPQTVYSDAIKHKIKSYQAVARSLNQMKGCLYSGFPFVYGFTVYESFESQSVANTGHVPMPGPTESVVGGHAVLAVGYDDKLSSFIVRNSWGPKWGMKGYFTMPYAYLLDADLSDDFWTIRSV
jgi:C1A family cysteine protease